MTLAILRSRALVGMEAPEVLVEAHLANGLPAFNLVVTQLDRVFRVRATTGARR